MRADQSLLNPNVMKHSLFSVLVSVSALSAMVVAGCNGASSNTDETGDGLTDVVWEFDNADGWEYFHQDTATVTQYALADGKLALTTRAYTYDRSKMHTIDKDFAAGEYRWRTYVPPVTVGEQVSIGSWIYHDDHHELDFEVGSGKKDIREECGAAPDELLACMTNQDFPFKSGYTPIKPGWHDFAIRLDVRPDGNYTAVWSIDGEERQTLDLQFGPEYGFAVCCSVENLKFIGDTIPVSDYTALYDRVSFRGTKAVTASKAEE